jgi:type VI secretion system secreted protein VgrG
VTVGGKRTRNVTGDEAYTTKGHRNYTVDGKETLLVTQGQEVTINDLRTLRIKEDQVTVTGLAKLQAGAREVIAGKRYTLGAEVIELTGTNSITLRVGGSSIKIDDDGVTLVSADGKRIKLN